MFACGKDDSVSGITVVARPDKTEYTEGEIFDPAGMVVAAEAGGQSKIITDYDYTPKRALKVSDTTVTVMYEGFYTTVDITVNPAEPAPPEQPKPPGQPEQPQELRGVFVLEAIWIPNTLFGEEPMPVAFLAMMAAMAGLEADIFGFLADIALEFDGEGTVAVRLGEVSQEAGYRLEGEVIVLLDSGGEPFAAELSPLTLSYKSGKVRMRVEIPELDGVDLPDTENLGLENIPGFDGILGNLGGLGALADMREITVIFGKNFA